jgi:hypothetical protein
MPQDATHDVEGRCAFFNKAMTEFLQQTVLAIIQSAGWGGCSNRDATLHFRYPRINGC